MRLIPIAFVAVAVAGTAAVALVAGEGESRSPTSRATPTPSGVALGAPDIAKDAAEAPLPRPRPQLAEPVAGQTAAEALDDGFAAPTDVAPPPGKGGADDGGRVSPGAPSDAEVRDELEAIQREQKRVKKLLSAGRYRIVYGSGRLGWPLRGPVTSPFGQRWGRLHAGIDIGVPSGTPIRASDGGTVVVAGWVGGYGNYVCVQHTKTLSTCYAHQSRMAVRPGQDVQAGQLLGYVGCTGHCFGDHLHYEVRVNGQPTDPMQYL